MRFGTVTLIGRSNVGKSTFLNTVLGEPLAITSPLPQTTRDVLLAELDVPTRDSKVCQGTLLSRAQYLVDIDEWGYEDARLRPRGAMTEEQVRVWTAAIDH